jgi:hypothetical protein
MATWLSLASATAHKQHNNLAAQQHNSTTGLAIQHYSNMVAQHPDSAAITATWRPGGTT